MKKLIGILLVLGITTQGYAMERDKEQHVIASFAICKLTQTIIENTELDKIQNKKTKKYVAFCKRHPRLIAAIVTAIIGATKELVWDDLMGNGECDSRDMLANFVGIGGATITPVISKSKKEDKYMIKVTKKW